MDGFRKEHETESLNMTISSLVSTHKFVISGGLEGLTFQNDRFVVYYASIKPKK